VAIAVALTPLSTPGLRRAWLPQLRHSLDAANGSLAAKLSKMVRVAIQAPTREDAHGITDLQQR